MNITTIRIRASDGKWVETSPEHKIFDHSVCPAGDETNNSSRCICKKCICSFCKDGGEIFNFAKLENPKDRKQKAGWQYCLSCLQYEYDLQEYRKAQAQEIMEAAAAAAASHNKQD